MSSNSCGNAVPRKQRKLNLNGLDKFICLRNDRAARPIPFLGFRSVHRVFQGYAGSFEPPISLLALYNKIHQVPNGMHLPAIAPSQTVALGNLLRPQDPATDLNAERISDLRRVRRPAEVPALAKLRFDYQSHLR